MSGQHEPMDQARLLERMQQEYTALEAVLTALDAAQMDRPGVYGDLSVKDVLAHLAAWQGMEIGWLQTSLRGESVVRYAPGYELLETEDNGDEVTERINAHIFAENQSKPLAAVLDDLQSTRTGLLTLVQTLSDADLNDPHRFDWWDGEPIWTSIAGNSYEHVREHRALIESWRASGGQTTPEEE